MPLLAYMHIRDTSKRYYFQVKSKSQMNGHAVFSFFSKIRKHTEITTAQVLESYSCLRHLYIVTYWKVEYIYIPAIYIRMIFNDLH